MKRSITCTEFRPLKRNTLHGFALIAELKLEIKDVAVHEKAGRWWAQLPAKTADTRRRIGQGCRRPGRLHGHVIHQPRSRRCFQRSRGRRYPGFLSARLRASEGGVMSSDRISPFSKIEGRSSPSLRHCWSAFGACLQAYAPARRSEPAELLCGREP